MTDIDALRDRLAELCGWKMHYVGYWYTGTEYLPDGHPKNGKMRWEHPFPPNDYNALIAAWPEEWSLRLFVDAGGQSIAMASIGGPGDGIAHGCDTEYEARLRLTVAVMEASRK